MAYIFKDTSLTVFFFTVIILFVFFSILFIVKSYKYHKQNKYSQLLQKDLQTSKNRIHDLELAKENLESRLEDLSKTKDQLSKIAYSDYLTGLPNRNALINMLDSIMYTLRNEEIVALSIIDISEFKEINTSLGYPHGDELLIDVAHVLQEVLDENDYITRYGADEFAILTQNIPDTEDLKEKLDKVKLAFEKPFILAAKECFVNMNIGIAITPKDGKSTQILMKNAESALIMAQNSDRNSFCFYDDSIHMSIAKRLELSSELRKAIENDQFAVYYQISVNRDTGRPVGLEALPRWEHPVKGILAPDEFLDIAMDSGLIIPISEILLNRVCNFIKKLEDDGCSDFTVTIKLSDREFRDTKLISRISRCIEATTIRPEHLELEVHSDSILKDYEYAGKLSDSIRELGINFSISSLDDRYSLMDYLKDTTKLCCLYDEPLTAALAEEIMQNRISDSLQKENTDI